MRITIIIFLIITFFYSCESKKVDKSFETDFNYAIYAINNHEKWKDVKYVVWVSRFYVATSYLEELTGISGTYVTAEHTPFYNTKYDRLQDINNWEHWYNENKYNVTKEYSDSIKSLASGLYLRR